MIKVAQIIGPLNHAGIETIITNYYKEIDKTQITFDFIYYNTSCFQPDKDLLDLGTKFFPVHTPQNPIKHFKDILFILRNNNYNAVHVNLNTLSVFALIAARIANIEIRISHSHTTSSKKELLKNLVKNLLRPFSHIFVTDFFSCSILAGEYQFGKKIVKKNQLYIMKNAVDPNKFVFNQEKRNIIRTKFNIQDKEILIGHIGRFVTQKNHHYLIKLLTKLLLLSPEYKLLLIGDGPLKNQIIELAEKEKLLNNILFLKSEDDISEYYSAMDLFILPSLYEGLPIVGIEAQCNGLPLLISSEVTDEIMIAPNTEKFDLATPIEDIAKKINSTVFSIKDRKKGMEYISASNYNIHIEATKYSEYLKARIDMINK